MNDTVLTAERRAALKQAFDWHAIWKASGRPEDRQKRDEFLMEAGLGGLLEE
jgi:hypothetical protein